MLAERLKSERHHRGHLKLCDGLNEEGAEHVSPGAAKNKVLPGTSSGTCKIHDGSDTLEIENQRE